MTQYPLWQQLNTLKQATWVDLKMYALNQPKLLVLKYLIVAIKDIVS
jgi:hypothetical protein